VEEELKTRLQGVGGGEAFITVGRRGRRMG